MTAGRAGDVPVSGPAFTALTEALAAATPGPWWHEHEDYGDEWWFGGSAGSGQEVVNGCIVTDADHAADAALIVAAVNAAPALLAEVRALRATHTRLRELAETWAERHQPVYVHWCGDILTAVLDAQEDPTDG